METENKQTATQEKTETQSDNGKITLDELNKKIIRNVTAANAGQQARPKRTRKRMETIAEILRMLMELAGEPESAIAEQVAKCYAEIEE